MRQDAIKKLEEEKAYLLEWVNRLGTARNLAPDIQRKLGQIEWEIEALKNSPEEAEEIPTPNLLADIDRDYKSLTAALPMMPNYDVSVYSSFVATTTSGSAGVYEYVSRVGDLETPAAQEYSRTFTGLYHNLEATQTRPNEVRMLLAKFCSQSTINRFEEVYNNYYSFKSGVVDRKTTALSIRNFLDGVKGDLYQRARINPKEDMTWETMVRRLVKPAVTGEEENTLLDQEEKRRSLIRRLSDILKDRERRSVTNLEYIWTEQLAHVFTVLSLIKE